jgi:hypothetical protein
MKLQFSRINRFLPFLLFLGIALGFAEIVIGSPYNKVQVILIHVITSFLIGYTILIILANHETIFRSVHSNWQKYLILLSILIVIAIIASEVEIIFRTVVFDNQPYQFFSGGKMYVFNAIITVTIGIGSYISIQWPWLNKASQSEFASTSELFEEESIERIPLKQGEDIVLINIEQIVLFEAFDNYSLAYDLQGKKRLCDYSLLFLESKLDRDFIRIHRKHIVNKAQIRKIQAHLNGRYVLEMKNDMKVTSSKSYAPLIKSIIKLS